MLCRQTHAEPDSEALPMPAGTRTSPLFTAAANDRQITLHLIDASGDKWAENLRVPVAATAASIEAYAAAYQAATQASLYGMSDQLLRLGDADPDNADNLQRSSGAQGVNNLFKNLTTHLTQPIRLVAPIEEVMQGNQDIPLLSAAEMTAVITTALAVLTGFSFQRAQYTDRRERRNNPVIR